MRVISGHLGWVRCIAVDPSNEWFATGSGDRTIKVSFETEELMLYLSGAACVASMYCILHKYCTSIKFSCYRIFTFYCFVLYYFLGLELPTKILLQQMTYDL